LKKTSERRDLERGKERVRLSVLESEDDDEREKFVSHDILIDIDFCMYVR
jgi:hypothetical protein